MNQLATIETNRKAALVSLSIQFASADKAKTSFGYIGIISLSTLFSVIFLNDLWKLCIYIAFRVRRHFRQEKQQRRVADHAENPRQVEIEMERVYAEDLERKLERFHVALIRAHQEHDRREKE